MTLKKLLAVALALTLVLGMVGCGQKVEPDVLQEPPTEVEETVTEEPKAEETPTEAAEGIVLTDQAGRQVTVAKADRIVSGYYISTSALIALGLEERLVGIEAKADKRPIYKLAAPELLELPNVGTAKEFDLEGCIALEPDVVILPKRLQDEADTMSELGIAVLLVNPESPEELTQMLELLGKATGTEEKAEKIKAFYQTETTKVENIVNNTNTAEAAKVYIGSNSSFLATAPKDMYQAGLVRGAGGENVGDALEGDSWTEVSYEQILAFDPGIIIIPSEAEYTMEDITADPQLAEVSAVKNGNIYAMPNAFEAWDSPTTSWIMGVHWVVSVLHPEDYSADELKADTANFYKEIYGIEEIDTDAIGK